MDIGYFCSFRDNKKSLNDHLLEHSRVTKRRDPWIKEELGSYRETVSFFLLTIGRDSITPAMTDIVQFKLQNTLRCHTKSVNYLAVSSDCSRLISIGAFHFLRTHAVSLTND